MRERNTPTPKRAVVDSIKKDICECLAFRERPVIFPDLMAIHGFAGNREIRDDRHRLVYWSRASLEGKTALAELLAENVVAILLTSPAVYKKAGYSFTYPLVGSSRATEQTRFAPMELCKGERFGSRKSVWEQQGSEPAVVPFRRKTLMERLYVKNFFFDERRGVTFRIYSGKELSRAEMVEIISAYHAKYVNKEYAKGDFITIVDDGARALE